MMNPPFNPNAFITLAGNVPQNDNPPFTRDDFFVFFPQFHGNIRNELLDQFILMAMDTVLEVRWHTRWKYGMSLFVAHFATLAMIAQGGTDPTADAVMSAANVTGITTSESAGDLSHSQDVTAITEGLKGWANWNSTSYGIQFATQAKMLGKAGMYFV